MCNLFANTMPSEAMRRLFGVAPERDHLGNQQPLPAIWPRDAAPVALRNADGGRALRRMHWGFLLPQVSARTGQPILPKAVNNARDDRLRDSPFWRDSFARRRCLIPATAFCETTGARPALRCWFALTGEQQRPPFAFAAVWTRFSGVYRGEAVEIDTVSMITTTPNALVRTVHPDRMPAILEPADHALWLDGPPNAAFALIAPYPAEAMRLARSGVDATADPIDAGQ